MSAVAREITIRGQRYRIDLDHKTSTRLARVRRAKTAPETAVRYEIRQRGIRYRTENRDLPGSPDFANRKARWAIFVNGCYWHHHAGCHRATVPKANREFWLAKFSDNRRRDARAVRALQKLGFTVIVIWECSIEQPSKLQRQLRRIPGGSDVDERG